MKKFQNRSGAYVATSVAMIPFFKNSKLLLKAFFADFLLCASFRLNLNFYCNTKSFLFANNIILRELFERHQANECRFWFATFVSNPIWTTLLPTLANDFGPWAGNAHPMRKVHSFMTHWQWFIPLALHFQSWKQINQKWIYNP